MQRGLYTYVSWMMVPQQIWIAKDGVPGIDSV